MSFSQDNSTLFKNGPNKGRPATVTTCQIWLVKSTPNSPVFIAKGVTTLGRKDKADSREGCKYALTRALAKARLGQHVNALIWQEFRLRHKVLDTVRLGKVSCRSMFNCVGNFSGLPRKLVDSAAAFEEEVYPAPHGYGGLYSWQRRALRKQMAVSNPTGRGVKAFYMQSRHEYQDERVGRAIRATHGTGKTLWLRKLHGLGWKRIIDNATGEQVWPRNETQKADQYSRMYGYRQQAEDRCPRVGDPVPNTIIINHMEDVEKMNKILGTDGDRIKEIIEQNQKTRQWLRGAWKVSDDLLEAKMTTMELLAADEHARIDADLVSRPGIEKVAGEYIIDPDEFVSAYRVGQVLRYEGKAVRVRNIHGPSVTVQPLIGGSKTVMDWELELLVKPSWIVRAWRTVAKYRREGKAARWC